MAGLQQNRNSGLNREPFENLAALALCSAREAIIGEFKILVTGKLFTEIPKFSQVLGDHMLSAEFYRRLGNIADKYLKV
jgi:hypothetical protein